MLRLLFTHNGYVVTEARDRAEALELFRRSEQLPAMSLLDRIMPVMSGVAFRARQRQDAALAHIPVAVISAAENFQEQAPELHAGAYIPKLIDFPEMLATVGRCCGQAQIRTS